MLTIALTGVPVVLAYTASIYWIFRGKVKTGPDELLRAEARRSGDPRVNPAPDRGPQASPRFLTIRVVAGALLRV